MAASSTRPGTRPGLLSTPTKPASKNGLFSSSVEKKLPGKRDAGISQNTHERSPAGPSRHSTADAHRPEASFTFTSATSEISRIFNSSKAKNVPAAAAKLSDYKFDFVAAPSSTALKKMPTHKSPTRPNPVKNMSTGQHPAPTMDRVGKKPADQVHPAPIKPAGQVGKKPASQHPAPMTDRVGKKPVGQVHPAPMMKRVKREPTDQDPAAIVNRATFPSSTTATRRPQLPPSPPASGSEASSAAVAKPQRPKQIGGSDLNPSKASTQKSVPPPTAAREDDDSEDDESGDEESGHDESEDEESEDEESGDEDSEDEETEDGETLREYRRRFLERPPSSQDRSELLTTPLFSQPVLDHARRMASKAQDPMFSQYSLLGSGSHLQPGSTDSGLFYNVAAPSSAFICGSQGSGKSHSLSCLLESCLIPSKLGRLPRPLTGLVFHYDTFISDTGGTPCEAAYLSSHPKVKVRVLCPPTNIRNMREMYSRLPRVSVEELRLDESSLNTKRMLDLMAVSGGAMPLYMQVVQRLLREMRIEQQRTGGTFDYASFRHRILNQDLTPAQSAPLLQRLDTLESFMAPVVSGGKGRSSTKTAGTGWMPQESQLTIVDLSCPCVTAEMACSLFNICLSLFLEQDAVVGRVVALDEAHKYMGDSAETQTLTNSLLATIRLQRHLGTRVVISTQEPTVSPMLLDLCSITIVHRFTSPEWLRVLRGHLAGISTAAKLARVFEHEHNDNNGGGSDDDDHDGCDAQEQVLVDGLRGIRITSDSEPTMELFSQILRLRVGEALVFAPSAIVSLEERREEEDGRGRAAAAAAAAGKKQKKNNKKKKTVVVPRRLDHNVLHVSVRKRLTDDGGKSIMAS
ncbi:hypothetical protein GGR56DRAFT_659444 [Xylariaceae sp. FL0804]|nr:hypothetical protein GGR56DRAFT_659444 [Xylariaceae sp. FL0804]